MIRLCSFLVFTAFFTYQDIVPVQTPKEKTEVKETRSDDKSASVIFCDSQPNRFIVTDNVGKWLPTVKNVDVKIEFGLPATVTCVLYDGVFKPTNPQTKTFTLTQMKTVSSKEFQQMIDTLQTDTSVKKLIKDGN